MMGSQPTPDAAASERLPEEARRRVEEFVRPLYAGLDGVQTFGRVRRVERRLRELAAAAGRLQEDAGGVPDGALLELLALFHGVLARLGSLGRDSRFDLFVRGLGVGATRLARLRDGLARYADRPETLEEELLHDACLLEEAGMRAAVGRLLEAGRRRVPVERALAAFDAGPSPERLRTPTGAAVAARRRRQVVGWIEALRRAVEEEAAADGAS